MANSAASEAYLRIVVRTGDVATAELVSAVAFEAGVAGIEEREAEDIITLLLYTPAAAADAVRNAVVTIAPDAEFGATEAIVETDWSEQWKAGLEAAAISPRLLVRPSFVDARLEPGQRELIIDPGQAFGTGGHPSTHLALEWIDAVAPELEAGWRVLDVGTGTGVLSLAALHFGASGAVAFDLDPLAIEATRENAQSNALLDGLALFIGSLDALAPVEFDLVAANLLRTELLPLIDGIAERLRAGGRAVFSGLRREECDRVLSRAAGSGLALLGERNMPDANGDVWSALLMTR